ncbi:MAG: YkgJ family cysteine cluster protein [Planctomycetaceae bacterium]
MPKIDLQLPTIQNWSCHNCGDCCKQHVIEITEAEKKRIEGQRWDKEAATKDKPIILTEGKTHRLAHRDDGACVFLDDKGLCRIHAKFGEPAKPLACRIYPYAFHPAGDEVAISLRFSCPSVVENKGTAVTQQASVLKDIAAQVVPKDYRKLDAPLIAPGEQLEWDDFLQFVDMIDAVLDENVPVLVSVLRCITICELLEQGNYQSLSSVQITELLQLVAHGAMGSIESVPTDIKPPRSIAKRHFRMLVAQYTRQDTMVDAEAGFAGYWNRFKTSLSFTRGKGTIPAVRSEFGAADFSDIEKPFVFEDEETADEILKRYLKVKVQGIHFCGPAYYNAPFVEGLRSLLLVYPAVMWFARWRAAGESRDVVTIKDIVTGMTVADHNHGYSEVLGLRASRYRVQLLAKMKQLQPLCQWYSRTR